MHRLRRTVLLHARLGVFAFLTAFPASAHAGDDVAKAAKTYRQAQQAELSEEFALAADLYVLADEFSQSAPALRGAMRMSLRAERWAVAAGYALEIVERYPEDPKNAELAKTTLDQTRPLLVEVAVDCGPEDCEVVVDSKVASTSARRKHAIFVRPGPRTIAGGYADGASESVEINLRPGDSTDVALTPPDPVEEGPSDTPQSVPPRGPVDPNPQTPQESSRRARLSPWWFAVGTVATLGVAGGAVASGLQARSAAADFREGGYTEPLYDDAAGLELQTNVLVGVAAGLGVVTTVFAILTDWERGKRGGRSARMRAVPNGAGTGFSVTF